MLVRSTRTFVAAPFLYLSSLSKFFTKASNLNESLGIQLFRLRDPAQASNVIAKWKKKGRPVDHSEIFTAVRGLITHRRPHHALMIWDSLFDGKIITLNPHDHANYMDLIANIRGLNFAENYFERIPKKMKREITYTALLKIYVKNEETAKAEALIKKMVNSGFLKSAHPYIHMMSLYMSIGNNDKTKEMMKQVKKRIQPGVRIYTMWLSACACRNNLEAADMVLSEMKKAKVTPNLVTLSTVASLCVKNKFFEKAGSVLREMEGLISTGYRRYYCFLMCMHGDMGDKDEVLRIWDKIKLEKGKISDSEYRTVIYYLLKCDSYEKAEDIHSEWGTLVRANCVRLPMIFCRTSELLRNAKAENKLP